MKNIFKLFLTVFTVAVTMVACKKNDYFVGGTLHNAKVNLTTYDFLKNNKDKLFDTLLILVDKAGIKDKINQPGISFFAPTNYSINAYFLKKTLQVQKSNPSKRYTLDTLIKYDLDVFKDSINVYIAPKTINYDNLTEKGTLYATAKTGVNCVVSFEATNDPNLGYNANSTNRPQLMYYTFLLKPITSPFVASEIPPSDGIRNRIQTSGIETTTGMVHVLENAKPDGTGHVLFFKK